MKIGRSAARCRVFAAMAALALSLAACATFTVKTPDLAAIPDGSYRGSAEDFPVAATVDVSMSGGRIERILIVEHQTMLGKPAEVIVDRVVEKQSLEVDCVTGATMSSRVILKAIEKALVR